MIYLEIFNSKKTLKLNYLAYIHKKKELKGTRKAEKVYLCERKSVIFTFYTIILNLLNKLKL